MIKRQDLGEVDDRGQRNQGNRNRDTSVRLRMTDFLHSHLIYAILMIRFANPIMVLF